MKIKVKPEDFRVEELLQLRLTPRGHYSVYRLEKCGWTTLSVLNRVERIYRLRRLSRAGLKDRYSCSVQYVSAEGRGPALIDEGSFSLKHIGYSTQPVTRSMLLGNRFGIVIRDLTGIEAETARRNLPLLQRDGFPNYHDEQRFGSARHGQGFIAEKLIRNDLEGALRLYMATPSAHDDEASRRSKEFLDQHWGDWVLCLKRATREFAPVVAALKKAPDDFAGAICRIQHDLLELFVTSFQSYLWNETLAVLIRGFELPVQAMSYAQGELLFFADLTPAARRFFDRHEIPMASPQTVFGAKRIASAVTSVLTRAGLGLKDLTLPVRIHGIFFKPYSRPGVVVPQDLRLSASEPDEMHPGRQKLELTFELPPGSFATILVKRLMLAGDGHVGPEDSESHRPPRTA